ncbi:MAG: hypothetical protein R3189_02445 [Thiomicrorhabdus chilensis]|uniref:hypothetical protein n=1 Tax=Thiomicrorhabdus chilensis TaxID=63656 RepID=UPI00299EBE7A|nr:hypothetical protein [Thiomicrorhabdus chilensis]MDX1347091.1 hypothetical protein [Thiomicrorhabdus chilensis]
MIQNLNFKWAVYGLLAIFSGLLLFHFLVILQVIPYAIVWGGKLESVQQMQRFETEAIIINLIIIGIVLTKAGYILRSVQNSRSMQFVLWVLVIAFSINALGNFLADTSVETLIFTPLTLLSAVLMYRLAIERQ